MTLNVRPSHLYLPSVVITHAGCTTTPIICGAGDSKPRSLPSLDSLDSSSCTPPTTCVCACGLHTHEPSQILPASCTDVLRHKRGRNIHMQMVHAQSHAPQCRGSLGAGAVGIVGRAHRALLCSRLCSTPQPQTYQWLFLLEKAVCPGLCR